MFTFAEGKTDFQLQWTLILHYLSGSNNNVDLMFLVQLGEAT